MISCPSCNAECPENSNFCLNCGSQLKSILPKSAHCDIETPAPIDAMTQALKRLMPTSYVEKLLASKGKMESERRVVSILFSDVKGSTSLAENLDPEEVLEVMNGAFNVLIEPITRYEGTIARLMGDAILAFFGAPIAHEDDPYRACRAALDIVQGANEFSKKLETDKGITGFGVRVGINTGLVVVAEVGTDFRVEYTAMGDAVNVAARMESAAEPGTVLITEATKKLVLYDFDLMSVGPIMVKGKSGPINTFRVLGIKNHADRSQETTKSLTPLIGRDPELNIIQESIIKLQNGSGGIVSITGDRGIGKSRLVREAYNKKPAGLKWAEGRALSYASNSSYWLAYNLIINYFGFYQDTCCQDMLEVIQRKVENHFGEKTGEIFPYLKYFLNNYSDSKETKEIIFEDLRATKKLYHFALKEFLKKESSYNPLVLIFEDLQWCDLSSLELLEDLLSLVLEKPVLFLLQYRLDENEKRAWCFHEKMIAEFSDNHIWLPLHSLDEHDIILLIQNLVGDNKFSPETNNQLIKKSEGNPSFLEELIGSISDRGESDSQKHFIKNNKAELGLPDSLQNAIMSRVDSLEQIDKITLQTAAVIGRVFPKKLLARVLGESLDESEFESSLKEIQLREFVLRHLPTNISSNTSIIRKEFIFKQDLAQSVLYNSLLISQRQALHWKIGIEIEKLYAENVAEYAESLCLHFEKGKDFAKAIFYNKMAADRAKKFFANEDAIYFYSRALDLSREVQTEPLVLAQIYESMGDICFLIAEYSDSKNHFDSALNYINDTVLQAEVYNKLGKVFERWGNYSMALDNYSKALKQINQDDEKTIVAHITSGIALVYFRQGNLTDAEKLITKAFQILSTVGEEKEMADVFNNMGII